jgi:hypothetical protein
MISTVLERGARSVPQLSPSFSNHHIKTVTGLSRAFPATDHQTRLQQQPRPECTPLAACDVQAGGMLLHKSSLTAAGVSASVPTNLCGDHCCCFPHTIPICVCLPPSPLQR